MKKRTVAIAAVALLALAGCGSDDPEPVTTQSTAPSAGESAEEPQSSEEYPLECSGFKRTNDQGFAELVTECRNITDAATPELNVTMVGEASESVVFFAPMEPGEVNTVTTVSQALEAERDGTTFTVESIEAF